MVAEDLGLSRVLHTEKRVQIVWRRGAPKIDKPKQLEFMRQNQTVTVVEGHPGGKFVLQVEKNAFKYHHHINIDRHNCQVYGGFSTSRI